MLIDQIEEKHKTLLTTSYWFVANHREIFKEFKIKSINNHLMNENNMITQILVLLTELVLHKIHRDQDHPC